MWLDKTKSGSLGLRDASGETGGSRVLRIRLNLEKMFLQEKTRMVLRVLQTERVWERVQVLWAELSL